MMPCLSRPYPLVWISVGLALIASAPAFAEAEAVEAAEAEAARGGGIEEITVTATKREQSLQEVPISMTALSASMLEATGLTEFNQMQKFVPNLQIIPVTDTRSTSIRIRGIGSVGTNAGIDPSVGVFIDGVYQGTAGMSVGDLLDIERVEVLRGPQGTLYGKNTAAGAITITTKNPSYEYETIAEAVIGNYNDMQFRGSVNVPLVEDRVSMRVSGYKVRRDGFDKNRFDGERVNDANKYGLRAKFGIDFTENLTLILSGDYSEDNARCCVADIITYQGPPLLGVTFNHLAAYTGVPLPNEDPTDRIVGADKKPRNIVKVGGVAADLLYAWGEHDVRWLSSYRTYTSNSRFDGDFSIYDAVVSFTDVDLFQLSSEATFTSPRLDLSTFMTEWLEYQAGVYLYYSDMRTVDQLGYTQTWVDANPFGLLFRPPAININDNTHEMLSVAGYGQATLGLTEKVSLTGGLRLSHERKYRVGSSRSTSSFPAPPVGGPDIFRDEQREVTQVSGTALLRYFPVDDVMVYASFANGFKSGGFNQLRTNDFPSEFDDEKSLSYELGAKTTWLDRDLTVNLTGFFTDYDDFQAQSFSGATILINNAGRLFSYGLELETMWSPVTDLLLGAALGFNIAEYDTFVGAENTVANQNAIWVSRGGGAGLAGLCGAPCAQDLSGRVLDNAPRWTLNLYSQYERELPRWPIVGFGRADYAYVSEQYLAQDLDPVLLQPGIHLLDLRAGIRAENELWELAFWVRNVTNEGWYVTAFDVPIVSGFAAVNAPPRTYGGTVRVKF